MRIFLDDSGLHDSFFPLTTLRDFKDLRTGIFSIQDRWARIAINQNIQIEWASNAQNADWVIPANMIPSTSFDFKSFIKKRLLDHNELISINHIWDLIKYNSDLISNDVKLINQSNFVHYHQHVQHIGDHPLLVHEKATIEHCFINTNEGPVIIDANAHVMSGSMLRGPIYVGVNSVIKMGAQLYGGCNIGESCVIGGEIKNSIFHSYSNKGHHGYIGDSYIGSWCNLGAGTTGSNIKNTVGAVRIWNNAQQQYIDGPKKVGVFMGDHVKTAINTSFNCGTIVSSFSNIFTQTGNQVPKFTPLFSWGLDKDMFYKLDNLLEEITRWMTMKHQQLTEAEKETIISLYKQHIK